MSRRHALGVLLLCACKAQLGGDDINNEQQDGSVAIDSPEVDIDAGVDGMAALGPWGTPTAVPGASSAVAEDDATMSSDRLELYFKMASATDQDLYVMTRANVTAAWSTPIAAAGLNTAGASPANDEESPRLSDDNLTIYFGRGGEIYKSTRASTTSAWGMPATVPVLNTTAYEKWADVCSNGYVIVSRAVTGQGQELFEGQIATGAPTALTVLNSTNAEQGTFLSDDCLTVYFQSNRDGSFDIFTSTRPTTSAAWVAPTKLPDFNTTTGIEEDPWISTDQRTFMFASSASGNKDVYISTR